MGASDGDTEGEVGLGVGIVVARKGQEFFNVVMFILHKILHLFICIYYDDQER